MKILKILKTYKSFRAIHENFETFWHNFGRNLIFFKLNGTNYFKNFDNFENYSKYLSFIKTFSGQNQERVRKKTLNLKTPSGLDHKVSLLTFSEMS